MNTGIQDAHNLAWKLAEVVAGRASDAFLDSYESERKPVSTHGADWALLAFMNHTVIDAGIGLTPGAPTSRTGLTAGAPTSRTGLAADDVTGGAHGPTVVTDPSAAAGDIPVTPGLGR